MLCACDLTVDVVHHRVRAPVSHRMQERDCMIAHGSANVLREKLFTQSDGYMTHICQDCGLIAVANLDNNQYYCPNSVSCKNSSARAFALPLPAPCISTLHRAACCVAMAASLA